MGCDIYADGLSCGRLEIYTEGLYTVFEASVYEAENLMRLYLKCRGSIIPLGVLRPCGGSAYMKRKFSRIQMQNFPGMPEEAFVLPAEESCMPDAAPDSKIKKQAPADMKKEKGVPEQKFDDGSMLVSDGGERWLALPSKLRKKVPGLRLRVIKGREYILFRY